MDEKYAESSKTPWTTADKWFFFGNICFSVGTLSVSIANLINLSNAGRISDFTSTENIQKRDSSRSSFRDDELSPNNYFRR
jgi:hypothetical protein